MMLPATTRTLAVGSHAATGKLAAVVVRLAALACLACGGDDPEPALFPVSYATDYVRVYPCRASIDHDLNHVAIWADPTSAEAYRLGQFPLPAGSVIVKEEFSDEGCGTLVGWTAMRRRSDGSAAAAGADAPGLPWTFQKLDGTRKPVVDGSLSRCTACHRQPACAARDFTCVEP